MSNAFNPFGTAAAPAVRSVVDALIDQMKERDQKSLILRGLHTRDGVDAETLNLLRASDPECIAISFSVGTGGRGNSRLDMSGADVPAVREALEAFDVRADEPDYTGLSVAESIERTICRESVKDSEDVVSFKLSLAAHSRAIRVPLSEWSNFLGFMENVGEWTEAAVSHYLSGLESVEASPRTTVGIDGTETTVDPSDG